MSQAVVIVVLMTVLAVAPGFLLLTTSFTRFAIVLGLTRNAIGSQNLPPNQVLVGLALFLTVFVMGPIFSEVNDVAIQPLLNGEIDQGTAFERGFDPLREFMLAQTRQEDLAMFMELASDERPATAADVSATSLVPAFVISELRTAFIIGFVIFVPFLVIDLIVAAVLMSDGHGDAPSGVHLAPPEDPVVRPRRRLGFDCRVGRVVGDDWGDCVTDSQVLDIMREAFVLALKVAGPVLLAALVIGVMISILQTVTQIQEMTLTFVPKLIGTGAVMLIAGKWMLSEITAWISGLWQIIPTL